VSRRSGPSPGRSQRKQGVSPTLRHTPIPRGQVTTFSNKSEREQTLAHQFLSQVNFEDESIRTSASKPYKKKLLGNRNQKLLSINRTVFELHLWIATRLGCLGNHRLQQISYMPDVTQHFHNADVMGSKAEDTPQSMQAHCSTCSVAPPIETASQLHFGCTLEHQSPGCGTGRTYNTYYSLRSVAN